MITSPRPALIAVPLPDYRVDTEPDHRHLGKTVDNVIRSHFLGAKIVARGVSADAHPDHDPDSLAELILSTGTDRYDPNRIGDRYDNVDGKHIDLFGFRRTVTTRMRLFDALSWGFYHSAIAIHGHPVRLDLLIIYDSTHLAAVLHRYEGRTDLKRDGFRFRNPTRKQDALLGVLKLGR